MLVASIVQGYTILINPSLPELYWQELVYTYTLSCQCTLEVVSKYVIIYRSVLNRKIPL